MYAVTLPLGRSFLTACLGFRLWRRGGALFPSGRHFPEVSGLFRPSHCPARAADGLCGIHRDRLCGRLSADLFFSVDEDRINEVYGD